ncbi:hypothetical protein Psch_03425 [Pelotomaculum schinkii]|uniref:Uncharacterized protein n=1 Tax=Pelotomaculum schinkii TaxID=78350 RepID=A0A4Y7R7D9_9FIRM|nr:hypothetical protein [Pelotomaculum schinkii]TEB04663.1 hypothetical protein Psch_03425 [Pelotomaculum schinkii]
MPLLISPFKLVIQYGGKINLGTLIITRDKVPINQNADDNAFNTGDACLMINIGNNEPTISLASPASNLFDDDLVD